MIYKVTTPPTVEPVTLAEAKVQCRVDADITFEDDYITALIQAAREEAESSGRALLEQTITLKMECFPGDDEIYLPRPPLMSVTSVSYVDLNGTTQTLTANTDYVVDTISEPGRIYLPYSASWPVVRDIENAITIVYKAGYGATAANVPMKIRQMMLMRIAEMYKNREGQRESKPGENLADQILNSISVY